MCSENGFLMDDGVVARLDEDTFLCHTTTGGADRIHGTWKTGCNASGGTGRSTPPT
jgi:glycine cleavage system aminomethyltransferase T